MIYDWFNTPPSSHTGKLILPQFVYLKTEMTNNISKLVNYYQNKLFDVVNEHLLVRILNLVNANPDRDVYSYVDRVDDQADNIAAALHMSCSRGYGHVWSPGVFYGRNVFEIILSDDRDFDPAEAAKHWREQCPVTVLRHPFTDLTLARADGHYKGSDESGVAVISINIPLLALQYRGWYREERKNGRDTSERIHEFVSMFPLTNMVYSHVDLCLFNRMAAILYYGLRPDELKPFKRCHPFYITDLTAQANTVLNREVTYLQEKTLTFDQVLEYIPALCVSDLRTVSTMPRVVPVRQVTWTLLVARLPLIRFLVRLSVLSNSVQNNWYLSRLKTYLVAMKQSKTLSIGLPMPVLHEIDTMILNDIEPYL